MLGLAKAPEPRLGDCWNAALNHYFDTEHLANLKPNQDCYPPSIFFQGMKFMLFGDPSLHLPAPDPKYASRRCPTATSSARPHSRAASNSLPKARAVGLLR